MQTESVERFLERKGVQKREIAKAVAQDESGIGKKIRHVRPMRMQDLVAIWIYLGRRGINMNFGTLAEKAAVGLGGYDVEVKKRDRREARKLDAA